MLPIPATSAAVPALPDPFVPRPRLLAALDADGADVVLVCAPAGFGKTALLAHWARDARAATYRSPGRASADGWPTPGTSGRRSSPR